MFVVWACGWHCITHDCTYASAPVEKLERAPFVPPDPQNPPPVQITPDVAAENSEADGDGELSKLPGLLPDEWHHSGSVTAEYLYTGEGFQNTHGGIRTRGATRYRGNADLTLRLATGAAKWWDNGTFFVYLQHAHGTSLSPNYIGDGQLYSNLDTSSKAQDLTQLGEYWYKHTLDDEATSIKIGRQDANADFAYADLAGDFVNSSFATLPNVPLPYWPFQTLGLSAISQVSSQCRIGGGIYDQGQDIQQWWMNTVERGVFILGQADFLPFAECEDALLTQCRIGAWYSTSNTLSVADDGIFDGNYGAYFTLDRMMWTEDDDQEQGLGGFVQGAWCPSDRNQVDRHVGAGLIYRGLINGREADTLGAGFTLIMYGPEQRQLTGQAAENAVEAFYKARLSDWLAIQPDVQYITTPSGMQRDAFVVGVRFEAIF